MSYFEQLSKDKLRELQDLARAKRVEHYNNKYRKALHLYEQFGKIEIIEKYFKCNHSNAYKMIAKGKELKNADFDNS